MAVANTAGMAGSWCVAKIGGDADSGARRDMKVRMGSAIAASIAVQQTAYLAFAVRPRMKRSNSMSASATAAPSHSEWSKAQPSRWVWAEVSIDCRRVIAGLLPVA
jgi:hypothetical protein